MAAEGAVGGGWWNALQNSDQEIEPPLSASYFMKNSVMIC